MTTSTCRRSSSDPARWARADPAPIRPTTADPTRLSTLTDVRFTWTSRHHGAVPAPPDAGLVPEAPTPWTWLRQVHGAGTVVVEWPGGGAGAEADAAVTATPGCTLAVRTADCVPIVVVAGHGKGGRAVGGNAVGGNAVGVIHAGWRGLVAGVVGSAVTALRHLSSAPITATLGPSIHAGCYEFDGPGRDELAGRFGTAVQATTSWGTPALDLRAAAVAALTAAGADTIRDDAPCTACDHRFFSHRARRERERFATLAWLP